MSFSSCLRKRILLSQPMRKGVLTSTVVLLSSSVVAPAIALEWQVDNSRNSTAVEHSPNQLASSATLSSHELIQTIRGLELVEVFNFPTVESEAVRRVQTDLRQVARRSSSPYKITQSQIEQLRKVFSKLSEEELAAVNQMLVIQQAQNAISIPTRGVNILQKALQEIPHSNLSQSQQKQLTVISRELSEVSGQQEASFSSQKLESLQSAIAQVFFTPDTRASQTANQTQEREAILVANANFTNFSPEIAQAENNPSQGQSQRQQFRSNLAAHLNDSDEQTREFLLSTLIDHDIPQTQAEELIGSLENMFQEVEGGEILFRIEMARRIQTAQNTFNEVLQELDTEILETPPDSLLIIRGVIAESVAATRSLDDVEVTEEPSEPFPDDTPATREDLISQLLIPDPETEDITIVEDRAVPALGLNVPSGFGSEWGQVFAGIAYQATTRPIPPSTEPNDDDGAFAVGMGFGDPEQAVGLEAVYTSFSTFRSGPFSTGGFSFKLHRRLTDTSSAAIGVENLIQYGGADGFTSYYGTVTNIFNLSDDPSDPFSRLVLTGGLGSGRFRQFQDTVEGKDTINFFGSAGLQVAEPVSLLAAYTGQTLTLGASVAPFRDIPLVITPSVTDITGDFIDSPRFVITIGYGDRLFNKD